MPRAICVRQAQVVRAPPARIASGDSRRAKRPHAVALFSDAILGEGREVLIAVDVERHRRTQDVDRAIARRLRPRARVEVALEVAAVAAVVRGHGGKNGLAQDGFE